MNPGEVASRLVSENLVGNRKSEIILPKIILFHFFKFRLPDPAGKIEWLRPPAQGRGALERCRTSFRTNGLGPRRKGEDRSV